MRVLLFLVLLAALPCVAEDELPDPGRRLSEEEMSADPAKKKLAKKDPRELRKRDEPACERARLNQDLACGAPSSRRSYSFGCTEAMVLRREAC